MVRRLGLLVAVVAATSLAYACSSDNGVSPAPTEQMDGAASDAAQGSDAADASSTVSVQLLAINDFHGNLDPPTGSSALVTAPLGDPIADGGADSGIKINPDAGTAQVPVGGAVYLATHVKTLRASNPNTAIVSAGDLTGASPLLSNIFRDEPSVLAMNTIGLDYEGVGNHDFDRGLTELLRLQNGGCSLGDCDAGLGMFPGAKFKYLAANVDETTTNMSVFPPYDVKTFGAAKVAFIGMTLRGTPNVTVASAVAGLSFQDEVATVNALIPELKAKSVDAIVVLLHQGAFQDSTGTYDSCAGLNGDLLPILRGNPDAGTKGLDPAVDVVVSAHTHQAYDCTIDGRLVTSAASYGRVITKIDLTLDPTVHKVVDKHAHNLPVTRDVQPDSDVASLIATYAAKSAPLRSKVVGYISGDLIGNALSTHVTSCETPLGDVIADSQLAATSAASAGSAQIALMNPGGIRADISASSPTKTAGTVTYEDAFAVEPFSNNLVTVTLSGAQIKQLLDAQFASTVPKILQVSNGFSYSYTYDALTKTGTVDPASIKLNGIAIDPATSYRVTANAFLAQGGDGFSAFAAGTNRVSGQIDLDALVAYFGAMTSASSPLAPPAPTRITGNVCPP
jgi:5'-nucleotidase